MTSQDLCHTSRHFVTRQTSRSRHTTESPILQWRRYFTGWQRFSYFWFIHNALLLARPGSLAAAKPICYTWIFISHHRDRSLSIMDGLLAWRLGNTVSWKLQFFIIRKKLDHGFVVNRIVWLLRWWQKNKIKKPHKTCFSLIFKSIYQRFWLYHKKHRGKLP